MYKSYLLSEAGWHQKNIDYLISENNRKKILNKVWYHEQCIRSYIQLNQTNKICRHIDTLIAYLPENQQYIEWWVTSQSSLEPSRVQVLSTYNEKYRSGISVKLLMQECNMDVPAEKEMFISQLKKSCYESYKKIVPSFFKQIKSMYGDSKKAQVIEEVLLGLDGRLDAGKGLDSEEPDVPTTKMFSLFVLAHHYLRINDLAKAMEFSEACKVHTPTFVENYMVMAKIYKKQLDIPNASKCNLDGFKLDLADRYPCNKSAKYLLSENRINEADLLFKTFMKDDKSNEKNIHDLQKVFYELPLALAYLRQNKWGRGLRQLHFIFNHYNEIDEEQIDFFSFALRKYSLIGFVQMVKLNCKEIGENRNYIMGHAHYLKYAMAWLRSEKLEESKAKDAPKVKQAWAKRRVK